MLRVQELRQPLKAMGGKSLRTLDEFIAYCETTRPEDWLEGRVRSLDNSQNCCFGHLINWYYGKDYEGEIGIVWDYFEDRWATTYMIYRVNDGEHPNYQQETARERVIAYLKNLNSGLEKSTADYLGHKH